MEQDRKRKKLPGSLKGVWRLVQEPEACYVNQNGFRTWDRPVPREALFRDADEPHLLYTQFDDGAMRLSVNEIHADADGFYGTEVTSVLYCERYNEMDLSGAGIEPAKSSYAECGLDGARQFMERVLSGQSWLKGASRLLKDKIVDTGDGNVMAVLDVFVSKWHKMFPLILEHADRENVAWLLAALLSGDLECRSLGHCVIQAKALNLALESGLRLDTAIRAAERFNPSEVAKFAKLADFVGSGMKDVQKHYPETDLCVEQICGIPGAEFTRVADYMVKQSMLFGNFKMESGLYGMLSHIKLYADYVRALDPGAEEGCDLYPDNLQLAHDVAIKAASVRYKGKEYNVTAFRKATEKYACLAWEHGGYRFAVPSRPEDLIRNASDMGHCVDGYIDDVIKGRSKIVIVTKDGVPDMTIEVNRDSVTQAKAKGNRAPDGNARRALHAWIAEKGLTFVKM